MHSLASGQSPSSPLSPAAASALAQLESLFAAVRRHPCGADLPPVLVDRCARWLPWLRRRRRLPWTHLRRQLTTALYARVSRTSALDRRSSPLWGSLYAIRFRRQGPRGDWRIEIW